MILNRNYTTKFYKYTDFETSGVITGNISDSSGNPVQNAFLIIQNVDNDYSNVKGKYNLVVLDSGEYDIKIEGPDTLHLNWSIFWNGNFLSYGDSVKINLDNNQIVDLDFKAPIMIANANEKNNLKHVPDQFILNQNFPNPFNPETIINYSVPIQSFVSLKIFDLLGNEIKTLVNSYRHPGNYSVKFDASEISSGIYFYRLQAGDFMQTKKMVLIR